MEEIISFKHGPSMGFEQGTLYTDACGLDVSEVGHYNAIIMQRKLIKVGTSAAVLIPAEVLKEQGVKIGDIVSISLSKEGKSPKKPAVDPALLEWTEKLMKRYEPTLKKLAHS